MTRWYEVDMNNAKCWAMYKKQMLEDLARLFKNGCPPPLDCKATFCDNFELTWFYNNTYTNIYEDNFENDWFTINTFINEGTEDFEDSSWDE